MENKLGVSYNVFDGTELLEFSINQIRKNVEFICVVLQDYSYHGKKINDYDLKKVYELKEKGLIDYIEKYEVKKFANNIQEAKLLEIEKRNLGREICKFNNCTYFLDMDSDEFFKEDEFKRYKEYIYHQKIDFSIVPYVNYIKEPNFKIINKSMRYSIFICRILNIPIGNIKVIGNAFDNIDYARRYDIDWKKYPSIKFNKNEINMHHMSFIRRNILDKFNNSSEKIEDIQKVKTIVDNIEKIGLNNLSYNSIYTFNEGILKLECVDNIFNINIRK